MSGLGKPPCARAGWFSQVTCVEPRGQAPSRMCGAGRVDDRCGVTSGPRECGLARGLRAGGGRRLLSLPVSHVRGGAQQCPRLLGPLNGRCAAMGRQRDAETRSNSNEFTSALIAGIQERNFSRSIRYGARCADTQGTVAGTLQPEISGLCVCSMQGCSDSLLLDLSSGCLITHNPQPAPAASRDRGPPGTVGLPGSRACSPRTAEGLPWSTRARMPAIPGMRWSHLRVVRNQVWLCGFLSGNCMFSPGIGEMLRIRCIRRPVPGRAAARLGILTPGPYPSRAAVGSVRRRGNRPGRRPGESGGCH